MITEVDEAEAPVVGLPEEAEEVGESEDLDLVPDELPVDELGLSGEDLPAVPVVEEAVSNEPLLSLDEAIGRVPAELRKQMEELLRADFREVQRWKPSK